MVAPSAAARRSASDALSVTIVTFELRAQMYPEPRVTANYTALPVPGGMGALCSVTVHPAHYTLSVRLSFVQYAVVQAIGYVPQELTGMHVVRHRGGRGGSGEIHTGKQHICPRQFRQEHHRHNGRQGVGLAVRWVVGRSRMQYLGRRRDLLYSLHLDLEPRPGVNAEMVYSGHRR